MRSSCTLKLLYFRGEVRGYCLWPHSSVDIEARYEEAKREITHVGSWAKAISSLLDTRPLVARRHYIETGNLRFLRVVYCPVADLVTHSKQEPADADGTIFVPLCENQSEHRRALSLGEEASATKRGDLIRMVAVPRPLDQLSILQFRRNDTTGGTDKGQVDDPGRLLDVRKSSPKDGTIRIGFGATEALRSGDEIEVKAILGGPEDHEACFWVKIVDPQAKPKETEKPVKDEEPPMGLPSYVLVYQEKPTEQPTAKTWSEIEGAGISMDWEVVMYPLVDESTQLTAVYINMDSRVLRNFKSKQGKPG